MYKNHENTRPLSLVGAPVPRAPGCRGPRNTFLQGPADSPSIDPRSVFISCRYILLCRALFKLLWMTTRGMGPVVGPDGTRCDPAWPGGRGSEHQQTERHGDKLLDTCEPEQQGAVAGWVRGLARGGLGVGNAGRNRKDTVGGGEVAGAALSPRKLEHRLFAVG